MKLTPSPFPFGEHIRLRVQVIRIRIRGRCCLSLQKSLLLAALVAVLLPVTAAAQEPAIEWEVVNPFRFIHDRETIDELKTIFNDLSDKSAAALERKLQDLAEARVDEIRRQARERFDCNRTTVPAERRQCFKPYAGWFAKAAEKDHNHTCWDSKNRRYRDDGPCADYIDPKSHRVRVWIANPESLGESVPQWTLSPALKSEPCHPRYGRRFCIEFDIDYDASNPQRIQVTALFPGGSLTTREPIQVFDRLIVGLGDSFAAGEGNPDIPAEFIDSDRNRDTDRFLRLAGHGTVHHPKKDDGNEAVWLDWRCHRSMYSYQFKTALQLALLYPRQAITYVTFSCSGAVTNQLISKEQKPNERRPGGKNLEPQILALSQVLRKGTPTPRPIDVLLLSTGGNDIGFADYVAYILLRQKPLLKLLDLFKDVSEKKMKESFDKKTFERDLLGTTEKPGNYAKLQKALLDPPPALKPTWIRIKECKAGDPCPRVLLTPYPNVLTEETGEPCKGDRLEFYDSFGVDEKREAKIETVRAFVFDQLKTVQKQVGARFGWTLIEGNIDVYARHGFCARNDLSESIGEKFAIPTWVSESWLGFDPRNYRAYESRFRWFRLPVDSKLTTDQHSKFAGVLIDFALEDVRSNIMHPTAEGLARTADLNVEAIRKIDPLAFPH